MPVHTAEVAGLDARSARPLETGDAGIAATTILARTPRGAAALVRAAPDLPVAAHRLLARLNGYTDLGTLVALAPSQAPAAGDAAARLLRDGLAVIVEAV